MVNDTKQRHLKKGSYRGIRWKPPNPDDPASVLRPSRATTVGEKQEMNKRKAQSKATGEKGRKINKDLTDMQEAEWWAARRRYLDEPNAQAVLGANLATVSASPLATATGSRQKARRYSKCLSTGGKTVDRTSEMDSRFFCARQVSQVSIMVNDTKQRHLKKGSQYRGIRWKPGNQQ